MKETLELIKNALEDKKAEDIKIIDISKISSIGDYFVIASGRNTSQIQALSDNVEEVLGRKGINPRQIEGYQMANWILLDYSDFIIHIFDVESRNFYDLERIWKDGEIVEI